MAFEVGQKVEAFDSVAFHALIRACRTCRCAAPEFGVVYTVTGLSDPFNSGQIFISLAELQGDYSGEGYPSVCFRPITEQKTDISIFTAMLNKAPVELSNA